MAIELGAAYVSILPDMGKFKGQMQRGLGKETGKMGKKSGEEFSKGMEDGAKKGSKNLGSILKTGMKGLGIAGLAAGAAAAFASPFVNAASDAQQSIGATEALFGQYADTVVKKSKEAAQEYGLSANEYRDSSNLLAALFKNQGVEMDQLAGKTDEMVGLGADLAAMYGGTTADAVEAMTAAYKGEFNSLEKYGITMKASTVNAEAMAVANVKSAKEWNNLTTEQQAAATQQATTNLLLKQSTDAQGQAARESDTYAGQMQRLQASLANTKETLGTALLPVVSSFVGILNKNVVPAIDGFISGMKDGTGWGGKVADVFGTVKGAAETAFGYIKNDVIPALQNFKDWLVQNRDTIIDVAFYVGALGTAVLAYKGYVMAATAVTKAKIAITKAWTAITKAQTVAQRALNLVMKMNPIGLVIAAITGLIGILFVAYKRHEGFRDLVNRVWDGIKNAANSVVTWFKDTAWPWMRDALRWIGETATGLYQNQMKPALDGIKSVANSVVAWFRDTAWPTLQNVFAKIGDVAMFLWNNIYKPYFTLIWNIWKTVFFWLRDTAWPLTRDIFNRIGGVVMSIWNNFYKPYFTLIWNIWKTVFFWLRDTAWPLLRDAFNNMRDKATNLKDKAVSAFDGIKSVVNSVVSWIRDTAWPWLRDALDNMRDRFTSLKDNAVDAWNALRDGMKDGWDFIKTNVIDKFKDGLQSLWDKVTSVKDGIARTWSALGGAFAAPINTVITSVNKFLENVRSGLNAIPGVELTTKWGVIPTVPVPGALTSSASTAGRRASNGLVMLASGGHVPGWSPNDRADNIPAMLTAGEYVLPVKATNRLRTMLGDSGLESLRRGDMPGYANGGLIGGSTKQNNDGKSWLDRLFEKPLKWVTDKYAELTKNFGDSWPAQTVKGVIGTTAEGLKNWIQGSVGGPDGVNLGGGRFAKPVPAGTLMSWPYGWRSGVFSKPDFHNGLDFRAPTGTPIYSAMAGRVKVGGGWNPMGGLYNEIAHAGGINTGYFHMSKALVRAGQQVRRGQMIGRIGNTGSGSRGSHLHFMAGRGGNVWSHFNPQPYLRAATRGAGATLYDNGGMIHPGVSLVSNQTGKPEMVLTNDQWTDIREGQGNTIVINGVDTDNATDVADELLFAMRRTRKGKYNRVR